MNLLWSNIFRKKPEEDSLAFFLGTVPVFSGMESRELTVLESLVHIRRYSFRETVFEEGDTGSGLYIVRTGRVQIFTRHANGQEEELAQLGPGDFFGETTLAAPASRSASARTLEGAKLIGLFRSDLMEMEQKHPALAGKILLGLTRILSERLQTAAGEIRRLQAAAAAPVESNEQP